MIVAGMRSAAAIGLAAAAIGLAMIYLAALLPVVVLGLIALADYNYLACPGANQCSDASFVMTLAFVYVLAGPILWLIVRTLWAAARPVQAKEGS